MSLNYVHLDVKCERIICMNSGAQNCYLTSFSLPPNRHKAVYIHFELERLHQQNSEEAAAPSVGCKMNNPFTIAASNAIYLYSPRLPLVQVTR